jgi:FixJ family two-component response regulator
VRVSQELLIAVVDDEESIRKALSRLLRASGGYRVQTYSSGTDFLESWKTERPDVVVLDLHMPGLSGFEVHSKIAACDRSLPVIVITGHDSPETRQRALDGGAAAYLRKPVDERLLLRAISGAMDAPPPG